MADPVVSIADARLAWETMRRRFAARGFCLNRRRGGGFRITRGRSWSIDLQAIDSVLAFAEKAGISTERAA